MIDVDISVNLCTYNRAEMLQRALQTLICQVTEGLFSYEIIVIDDGSTDTTSQVVSEVARNSEVPVIYKRNQGKGYTEALNTSVKESSGRWMVFFDDDELAERNWLKNLFYTATKLDADCVGGTRLLDFEHEHNLRLGPVCRRILGESIYKKTERCEGRVIVPFGNILVSRKIFDSIGLFDTSMVTGGCDNDLVLRARTAGYDIWTSPNAIVHHVIPQYRIEHDYFRWVCLRQGFQLAYLDYKQSGYRKMLLFCVARIGQALLVNYPYLFFVYLKNEKAEMLDRKCLIWRALGYTRQTLFLIAPGIFQQKHFFAGLDFRKEQKIFPKNSTNQKGKFKDESFRNS